MNLRRNQHQLARTGIWKAVAATGASFLGGCAMLLAQAPTAPPPVEPPSKAAEHAPDAADTADAAPADNGQQPAPPAAPSNPYASISVRNAFGLKDPPPPAPPPSQEVTVPVSALKLSGITALPSGKKAMFVLQEAGKQPVNSYIVGEGETDPFIANLRVVEINERAGSVKVVFGGKEIAVNFAENGLKPPVGPAVAAPGAPGPGGVVAGKPVAGVPGAGAQPPAMGGADNGAGLRNIPARPTRTPSNGANNLQGQSSIPAEQQLLNMHAQGAYMKNQGYDMPPPLPVADGAAGGGSGPPALPGSGGPPPIPQ